MPTTSAEPVAKSVKLPFIFASLFVGVRFRHLPEPRSHPALSAGVISAVPIEEQSERLNLPRRFSPIKPHYGVALLCETENRLCRLLAHRFAGARRRDRITGEG